MIRVAFVLSLILTSSASAASKLDPDFYKPINSIRSMEDVYNGLDAQSFAAHLEFFGALKQLTNARAFPLRLDDGNEIYRITSLPLEPNGESFYLEFGDRKCIETDSIRRKLDLEPFFQSHGPGGSRAVMAYAQVSINSGKCLSKVDISPARTFDSKSVRMLYDGSVSKGELQSLVERVNSVGVDPKEFRQPLLQLWRSQGNRHDDAVKVLKSISWQSTPDSPVSYRYFFAKDICIDPVPFEHAHNEGVGKWSVWTRRSSRKCVDVLEFVERPLRQSK